MALVNLAKLSGMGEISNSQEDFFNPVLKSPGLDSCSTNRK